MFDLEARLRLSSRAIDWPDADVSRRVMAAIQTPDRYQPARPRWALAAVAVVAVVVGLLVTPTGREAVANVLELVGIRVTWGSTTEVPNSARLDLGDVVSLEEAEELVDFELLVPDRSPDLIYHSSGSIHMVWESGDTGTNLLYSQLPGSQIFAKVLEPETGVQFVRLRGVEGIWIDGAPHLLQVIGADGELKQVETRLSANVLAWDEGGITHRLETTGSLEEALKFVSELS